MAKYGLIGENLKHSQSKGLHSLIGNYEYDLIEVADITSLKQIFANEEYAGFNVTLPYKDKVISFLDDISDRAKAANAVNVIKRTDDGKLIGFNTDINGFSNMIGSRAKDRKCLVFGSGGAARSVAYALELSGAKSVILVSRNPEMARLNMGKAFPVISYDEVKHYYDAQVLVNATPVGMIPNNGDSPMRLAKTSVRVFESLELAVDLIYNPYRTKFLQDAHRITGCKTMSGLEMLIYQAIESRNIWAGGDDSELTKKFEEGKIKRDILMNQLNLIAVGMPGSGKTTIFRRFAYQFGLNFIDIDEKTEELMGDTIENVLNRGPEGEAFFREMEYRAVREASKNTRTIIATGGGSILNPLNRDLLRSNGIVVYMKRPLDKLATKGRPISQNVGVEELSKEREKIYERMSDITIKNGRTFGGKRSNQKEGVDYYNYDMKKFVYYLKKNIERYIDEIASNKWT